jgi:hypothetical protein
MRKHILLRVAFFAFFTGIQTISYSQKVAPLSNQFDKVISEKNTELLKSMFKNPEHLTTDEQRARALKSLEVINDVVKKYPKEKIVQYSYYDIEDRPNTKLVMIKLDANKLVSSSKFQITYADFIRENPAASEKELVDKCILDVLGGAAKMTRNVLVRIIKTIMAGGSDPSDVNKDRTNEESESSGNTSSDDIDNTKDDKFDKSQIPAGTFFMVIIDIDIDKISQIEAVYY